MPPRDISQKDASNTDETAAGATPAPAQDQPTPAEDQPAPPAPEADAQETAPVPGAESQPTPAVESEQVPLTELAEQSAARWEQQWADQKARDEQAAKTNQEGSA